MMIRDQISAVQCKLGIKADGLAGPQTWGAIHRRICGIIRPPEDGTVDDRSERLIATLLPQVRPYARALVAQAAAIGITIVVTSGTRTYEEQDALYARGRTKPGPKVTNAQGGESNHNFGIAFDVTVFEGGEPVWESPAYKAVGALGRSLGLTWGGDWKSLVDEPHFELRPDWAEHLTGSQMLAELRRRKDAGTNSFA